MHGVRTWLPVAFSLLVCLPPASASRIEVDLPAGGELDLFELPPEVTAAMIWGPRFGGLNFHRSGLLVPGPASRAKLPWTVLGQMAGLDDGALADTILEGRGVLEWAGFRINRAQALVSATADGAPPPRPASERAACLLLGAALVAVQYRRRRRLGEGTGHREPAFTPG